MHPHLGQRHLGREAGQVSGRPGSGDRKSLRVCRTREQSASRSCSCCSQLSGSMSIFWGFSQGRSVSVGEKALRKGGGLATQQQVLPVQPGPHRGLALAISS